MKQLNEQLKDSIEAKTGTRPEGYALHEILNSASGEENATLVEAVEDFIANIGGGAAPTYADAITWDGDTSGLESVTITADETDIVLYKVSDNVLPAAFVSTGTEWGAGYTYAAENDAGSALEITNAVYSNGAFLCVMDDAETLIVCAYHAGAAVPIVEDPGAILPSSGTWTNVGENYIASITAAAAE